MKIKNTKIYLKPGVTFHIGDSSTIIWDINENHLFKASKDFGYMLNEMEGREVNTLSDSFVSRLKSYNLVSTESPLEAFISCQEKSKTSNNGILYLELTDGCNLNCSYCYRRFDNKKKNSSLISKEFFHPIFNIAKSKFDTIIITGGEPLIYPDALIDLCSKLIKLSPVPRIIIFTNGTFFLDNYVLKKLLPFKKAIDFRISYHFEYEKRIINAIKKSIDENFTISIHFVANSKNTNSIFNSIGHLYNVGVRMFSVAPIQNFERKILSGSHNITPEQFFLLWSKIQEMDIFVENKSTLYQGHSPFDNLLGWRDKNKYNTLRTSACDVGLSRLMINCDGTITLCPLIDEIICDITDYKQIDKSFIFNKIQDCYNLLPLLDYEKSECSTCSYRYLCMGSCQGNPFKINGKVGLCDYWAKEYFSIYFENFYYQITN